jgi:tight adherence protein B
VHQATVIVCGAAAWTALCLLIADWVYGQRRRVRRRVQQAVAGSATTPSEAAALFRGFDQSEGTTARLWLRVQDFVRQSGLAVTPEHLSVASLGVAAVGMVVTNLLNRHWSLACVIAGAGVAAPWMFVWYARSRRVQQITKQLPDAFDIMRRAVQAGQTVPSALQLAATECRKPLSQELSLCCEQQNLGLPYDSTMRDLAQRVPIPEVQIFAIAMIVQRQFGSNPVEILTNISDMIRKRARLAKRVQALTGEGRLQAIVLTILPIGVFVWLMLFRPDYIQSLIDRPKLLGFVAALQVIGTLWIRRTIRIDY